MRTIALFTFVILAFSMGSFAQTARPKSTGAPDKVDGASVDTVSLELAKAALAAHGGDKLKAMKSLLVKGSIDMNVMGQTMPGAFSTAFSGDKYFFELISPAQQLKQVYNGEQTYSSVQGFSLPPVTSLGFPVLAKIGDAGYIISAPGDGKKKGKGFRVTTPEGFYTDFFVDKKTKQVKSFESAYDMGGGRVVTTSVAMDEFELVSGVLVPKNYSQRFDLGTLTAYAHFKAKSILINSPIDSGAFAMAK
ncbi:MAG: hypothetical protein ABR530_03395 [Pyrinomonadaceae bacterium]